MLAVTHSFPDTYSLLQRLNNSYNLEATELHLHRDMIGSVYFVTSPAAKYVFKLFRCSDAEQALQSLDVIDYLRRHEYPVVPVVRTKSGESFTEYKVPEGRRIGILYEFLDGVEPDFQADIELVAQQVGQLHRLMDAYSKPLIHRGKEFFINRYIHLMKEYDYCPNKAEDLDEYGRELWRATENLRAGFCHGDLHSGNMVKTLEGTYVLFDFDIVSHAFPVIDVATLSDRTNFNRLKPEAYDDTQCRLDRFYEGYSKERELSDAELSAVFAFVAMRHYELIATIADHRLPLEGTHWLRRIFDQQYGWLMEWREVCERKRWS